MLIIKLHVWIDCQTISARTCLEYDNLHSRGDERPSPLLPKQLTVVTAMVRTPWQSHLGFVSSSICPRRKTTPLSARPIRFQGQVTCVRLFIMSVKEGEVQPPEEDEEFECNGIVLKMVVLRSYCVLFC